MEELQQEQCEQLETLNGSILILLLLIAGVLLSFSATVDQRDGLARALCRGVDDATDVLPKRRLASMLIVGTTGFFVWQACRGVKSAQEGSCADRRSARDDLLAAALVFAAGLIRLNNWNLVVRDRLIAASEELIEPQ